MCESIPPDCLAETGLPETGLPETEGRAPLPRRTVLAGLGSVLLAGCMPASSACPQGAGDVAVAPARPRRPAAPKPPAPPAYEIVTRETWGAESLKDNHDAMARITRMTLHHTAEIAGAAARTDAELVKGIQNFHRNTRGWADIGYHWIIGRDGKVYEGRKLHIQGAHAGASNNIENLGISVIGDFTEHLPPTPALRTLTVFLRAQQKRYGIGNADVLGHRELKPTACPGDTLFAWLQRFRATV